MQLIAPTKNFNILERMIFFQKKFKVYGQRVSGRTENLSIVLAELEAGLNIQALSMVLKFKLASELIFELFCSTPIETQARPGSNSEYQMLAK